ncbi:MAG TPA: Ig-like domain-containing protein [Pyrinomonadaceae bacterium]|nr:Ig-like domain-containing protein [Pyrinomonadaceae bacterium]
MSTLPPRRPSSARYQYLALVLVISLLTTILPFPVRFASIVPTAEAATSDLFFSEYIEGSSNNKALEIYNGTGAAINLAAAGYKVEFYSNGSPTTTASNTFALVGTIANNSTFVLAPTNANATILGVANQTSGNAWFNGNDAVVLKKGTTILDVIGQIGNNPGTEWGTGLTSTADNTIRRKSTICAGDADGSNAFDPSIEWDGFATDTFNGLGAHSATCGSATPTPTPTPTPANPTATGSANPANVLQGSTTLLTVNVSPGTLPTSTSYVVTGNLSAIGGSSTQPFSDNGNNTFVFNATVAANTTTGAKALPISVTDDQGRPASASIALNVLAPSGNHIVISQVYGGGGNGGSTYKNDFVELYNPTANTVALDGWSVQYGSATGNTWQITDLSGTLAPGQYYLIQEAQGAGGTTNLPTPNALGNIPMGATAGKIALVDNSDSLGGSCPNDPDLIDFVGYGPTANCFEGAGATPVLTNTTAALRVGNGNVDTDNNNADFTTGAPNPRFSTGGGGGGETAPFISATTPAKFGTNVLVDSNITINFSEPVSVSGNWFSITCPSSGTHTATVSGGPTSFKLDPDNNFANTEQCTVNVTANLVSDLDTSDPPDHMLTDYSWTFTTIGVSGVARNPDEHLVMGIPSPATTDTANENDYLMKKPEFALSYNRSRALPNWTSWHLDSSWRGSQPRTNLFRADPDLPAGWYQVNESSFSGTGFDRGHMCPSADRTFTFEENAATFLMTNMVPQAPDNNQVTWEGLESYARTLLDAGNEVYIISGGYGQGGIGRNSNAVVNTVDQGRVVVPAKTWKVLLVLPAGEGDDVARVTTSTRTIGVIMPNEQGINADWHNFIVSVDEVEALTGYNFFSNVPENIQAVIEANADGNTRPVANSKSVTTQEDTSLGITLTATDAESNPLTYNVTGGPSHGTVSGAGNSVTYTPASNYYGPDSFTFTASDKYLNSEAATVTINVTAVNDAPVVVNDDKSTPEDTVLSFPASDLTINDNAGANEGDQTLAVTGVVLTPDTHGAVTLDSGQVTYTPDHNYNGPASFDYQVCDNGTTNGTPATQCGNGTVNVTITSVNDGPVAVNDSAITDEDAPVTIDVIANDTDEDGGTPALDSVDSATNGSVSIVDGKAVFSPDANYSGTGSFSYNVIDGQGGTATGNVSVTINPINDRPTADAQSVSTNEDHAAAITLVGSDVETSAASLSFEVVASPTHGTLSGTGSSLTYTPAANYNGGDSFTFKVTDGGDGSSAALSSSEATVSISVTAVNDAPTANSQSAATNEDTPKSITLSGSDVETTAGNLTYTVTTGPAHGTLTGTGANLTYTPNLNSNEPDSFQFTVTDTGDGSSGALTSTPGSVSITINPVNDAPVANAGTDQTLECAGALTLNGSASSDVDGDTPLTYQWREGTTALGTGATLNTSRPFGSHTITLKVTDPSGAFSEDTVIVNVVDTTMPTITPNNLTILLDNLTIVFNSQTVTINGLTFPFNGYSFAFNGQSFAFNGQTVMINGQSYPLNGQTITIWSPSKKYHTVKVSDLVKSASDSCDSGVNLSSVVIQKVTSDEGSLSSNDIIIGADCKSVQLKADRNSNGNGRVYTITFRVRDAAGNATTLTRQVIIPRNGIGAIDSGVAYTVTSSCQ